MLAVELEELSHEDARGALLARVAWAGLKDVVVVEQLPMDKRHNAKIDYPALRKLLAARYFRTFS